MSCPLCPPVEKKTKWYSENEKWMIFLAVIHADRWRQRQIKDHFYWHVENISQFCELGSDG